MRPGPSIERMARTGVRGGGFGTRSDESPRPSSPSVVARRLKQISFRVALVDGRARRSVNSDARPTALSTSRARLAERFRPHRTRLETRTKESSVRASPRQIKAERLNESEHRNESHPL